MSRQFETVGDARPAQPQQAKIIIPGPQNEEAEMRDIGAYSPDYYNQDTSEIFKDYKPAGAFNGINTDAPRLQRQPK